MSKVAFPPFGTNNLANPTASVGLTAVNGTAATAMRSDGAPALDVTIAPTWTGAHIFGYSPRITIGSFTTTLASNLSTIGTGTGSVTVGTTAGLTIGTSYYFGAGTEIFSATPTDATHINVTARGLFATVGATFSGGNHEVVAVSFIVAPSTSALPSFTVFSNGYFGQAATNIDNSPALFFGMGSRVTLGGQLIINNIATQDATGIQINNGPILTGPAAATLQFGAADAPSPVAQFVQFQNVNATANTAGVNATIIAPLGRGTGTNGDLILQTGIKVGSGTGAPTKTTALTIKGETQRVVAAKTIGTGGYTVATLPAGVIGDRAYVTDATAPTYNAALTGGGAVTAPVFYNNAAWVSA